MITLFTPTYNRVHLLSRLYNSILMQDVIDVEWLIVDDGSIDDTEALIENFKKESIINIRYYKKSNGGKHTAINFGLQYAKGELFFIIDSDDVLAEILAKKIIDLINNKEAIMKIENHLIACDYDNTSEIENFYKLING